MRKVIIVMPKSYLNRGYLKVDKVKDGLKGKPTLTKGAIADKV